MASNVAIKISADTVDVEAKFAVASARVREFNTELNKLAREANTNGATDQLRQQMLQASESLLQAKNQASALSSELKSNAEPAMRNFSGAASLAKEALGAFGIGLSIGSVVEFGRSVLDSAAQLQHEAEVLDISVTALQAFTESAKLAGVQTDTVEGAIRRFNAAQGQAQLGTTEQAKAFNDLGVSAQLPADQALPAVARALLEITDTARRARDENILFGRSGQELNPALLQWAQGVDGLNQSLKDLGVTLSPESAEKAKAAERGWSVLFDRIKADWTPTIVELSDKLATFANTAYSLGNPFGSLGKLAGPGGAASVPGSVAITPEVAGLSGKAPPPNFSAPKEGADNTRRIADEQTSIWEQASQKRIEGEQQANAALLALGNESLEQFRDQAKRLEDARYQAALGGLQARQQIDKGDAVALARDNAEMEVLAVDHANKMAEIDNRYEEEHLRAVKEATDKESALRQAAFNADFAARQEQARLEITQIQQSNAEIEAINRQEVASKRAAMQEIGAVEGQLVRGIISGRQTAGQIATQLAQTLLEKELTADLEYLTQHAAVNVGILESDQATAQLGLLAKVAALAEGAAVSVAAGTAEITNNAYRAAAGTYAAVAQIPYVGPYIAPAAAVAAFAVVEGFNALTSFDVGTNYVPRDMVAQLHQGEAVVPARYNPEAGGSGGNSNALHMTNTFHISAGTPADVAGQMKKHMVGVFNDLVRGGYLKLPA